MENKISFDGEKWVGFYQCKTCNEFIECYANKECYLKRNLKSKTQCKKCSLEKQKGVNNPFYGKKHTEKTIKKISSSKKGVLNSDHMSKPEYRELLSKIKKELWVSGKMENVRVKMSNLMKLRIAKGELKGYNRSKAEDEIIEYLRLNNINCEPNYIINGKIFDIYIPQFNLLIEYNGDYWHCNPIKYGVEYFNKKKNKTAKEIWDYDKHKLDLAINNNYNCEIIWETDYKKNKNIIKDIIDKYEKN